MKFTTPFFTLRNVLKNKPLENTSCWIDDIQVPMKECSLELESNKELSNYWEAEFNIDHPLSSNCKVSDD